MKNARCFAAVILICGLAAAIRADFRPYAWTYQFMTMAPGFIEVEIYNSYIEPKKAVFSGAYWQRQLEMETGVMDRMDFSFYLTDTRQSEAEPLNVTNIKLRGRLKLTAEKDEFIFDPLLYIEYTLQQDRRLPDTWEIRAVIAKDIGSFNASLNLIAEEQINYSFGGKKFVFEYSAGASYRLPGLDFWAGVESTGDFSNIKYSLGPVFAYVGEHFWLSASAQYGLNPDTEYIKVQAVLGVVFDFNQMQDFKR